MTMNKFILNVLLLISVIFTLGQTADAKGVSKQNSICLLSPDAWEGEATPQQHHAASPFSDMW